MERAQSERSQLERIARQYRDEGYQVSVFPGELDLPPFLRDLGIDLLARRGEELVVVQVKASSQPRRAEGLKRISELTEKHPELRLDIVGLPATGEPATSTSIDGQYLCDLLDEATAVLTAGHPHAALLLTWSTIEGGIRLLANKEKVSVPTQHPALMLKTVFSRGLLSKHQYDLLENGLRQRNALVHGMRVENLDQSLVRSLAQVARTLLGCK